jgi:hypothetical protein
MTFVVAFLVGLAYGAADQYLGSLHPMLTLGSWTPTAALVSAPWLLLPFLPARPGWPASSWSVATAAMRIGGLTAGTL